MKMTILKKKNVASLTRLVVNFIFQSTFTTKFREVNVNILS